MPRKVPLPAARDGHGKPLPSVDWTDEDLLLLVRSGDAAAFGELFSRYQGEARRFARSLVHRDDVDDVVAEAFAKTLRAIDGGRGPVENPSRYLMVTVRTTAATLHARRAKTNTTMQRLTNNKRHPDEPEWSAGDPDLVDAFETLLPRWRHVIWWSEIEGIPTPETADRMGLPPAAVAALAYRARRALRDAYVERRDASNALD